MPDPVPMPMDLDNGQTPNDEIDDDDEDISEKQASQQAMPSLGLPKPQSQAFSRPNFQFGFYPNPSLVNLNLPPIIAQTLEMAAAAPPPPLPLLSTTKPLNSNAMPMPMTMSNENSGINAHNKPTVNDPVDEQIEKQSEKPSQPTESPDYMLNSHDSDDNTEISQSESSTNANSLAKPIETVKEYKPMFLFGNPLYQSSFFHQYNTFIPYFLYPFNRNNMESKTRKYSMKSKRIRSPQKSTPAKTIVINIS